jgi:hypothetical protein
MAQPAGTPYNPYYKTPTPTPKPTPTTGGYSGIYSTYTPKTSTSKPSPTPTGKTAANLAAEALAAYLKSLQTMQSTGGGGGGEIGYEPTSLPTYTPQAYNVNLPTIDWSFNPTTEQQGNWQTQAQATAAQEIDPQLQAIKTALEQYMAQGQNTRNELNPRYTNQSLAIANVIQNSVKQEAVNSAIRRGAENSGWLPSALMQAGQLETQQRGDVEAQRNQDLNALAALEAQQTQAAGEQNTTLEGLRGKRITTALADLENQAWQRAQQEKESQWNSALGGEQLRASAYGENASNQLAGYQTQASVAMSDADRQLQAAIAAANQSNTEYQNKYTAAQDTYARQLAAAQASQKGVTKTPLGYVQGIPYYSVNELNTLYQTYGLGAYKPTTSTSGNDSLTQAILKLIGG